MHELTVHDDAEEDIEALGWETGGAVLALLEALRENQALLGRLLEHRAELEVESAMPAAGPREQRTGGASDDPRGAAVIEVEKWQAQWRQGRDLWRLKVIAPPGHIHEIRVIYAYKQRTHPLGHVVHEYTVLAVVTRGDDTYELGTPLSERIEKAYEEL